MALPSYEMGSRWKGKFRSSGLDVWNIGYFLDILVKIGSCVEIRVEFKVCFGLEM